MESEAWRAYFSHPALQGMGKVAASSPATASGKRVFTTDPAGWRELGTRCATSSSRDKPAHLRTRARQIPIPPRSGPMAASITRARSAGTGPATACARPPRGIVLLTGRQAGMHCDNFERRRAAAGVPAGTRPARGQRLPDRPSGSGTLPNGLADSESLGLWPPMPYPTVEVLPTLSGPRLAAQVRWVTAYTPRRGAATARACSHPGAPRAASRRRCCASMIPRCLLDATNLHVQLRRT
jgi:hypothetical protein